MHDVCTEPPVTVELHMNNYPDDDQAHAKHVGHNTVNKYRKFYFVFFTPTLNALSGLA
jgi:hypothetical protein